jgi:hypothetical protein
MNRISKGIILGVLAGGIDILPMIAQHLSWDANLSAFSFWVVNGFLIASIDLKLKPVLKGIVVSFATLLPLAIIIGAKEPATLLPIGVMTLLLGAGVGYFLGKK